MSDFDPYHKWLGISPQHQPPNHYRLLSLDLYESDPEVIEAAVDRIVAFLQDVSNGPHAAESQLLLNEVSAARLRLLDDSQRAAYDAELQAALSSEALPPSVDGSPALPPEPPAPPPEPPAPSPAPPAPSPEPPAPSAVPTITIDIDTGDDSTTKSSSRKPAPPRPVSRGPTRRKPARDANKEKPKTSPLLLVSFVSAGVLVILVIYVMLSGGRAASSPGSTSRPGSTRPFPRQPTESSLPDFQANFDTFNQPPPEDDSQPAKKKRKREKQE